jgi:hypothetical protein
MGIENCPTSPQCRSFDWSWYNTTICGGRAIVGVFIMFFFGLSSKLKRSRVDQQVFKVNSHNPSCHLEY